MDSGSRPDRTSASEGQVNKQFDLPQISRLMYGHADHLIQTSFNSTYAQAWADHYGAVRGTNYNSEVTYIQDRADYILSTLPALERYTITTNNGGDFSVDSSQVSLQGTGSYKIRELFFDGLTEPVNVKWLDDVTWQVTLNLEAGANDITTDHIITDHIITDHITTDHITTDHITTDHITTDHIITGHAGPRDNRTGRTSQTLRLPNRELL